MPQLGYCAYTLRARVPFSRQRTELQLDQVDGRAGDLLYAMGNAAGQLASRSLAQKDERVEAAFRVDSLLRRGRTLLIEGASGPFGHTGRLEHVDDGTQEPISPRHASMIALRALLVVPPASTVGVLICEASGRSTLRRGIFSEMLRPIGHQMGFMPVLAAYADHEAWRQFLEDGEAQEVSYVYKQRTLEDGGPTTAPAGTLKITATGGLAARRGDALRQAFARLLQHNEPTGLELPTSDDAMIPQAVDDLEAEAIELSVRSGGRRRRLVVREDDLPQFVYPFDGKNRPGQAAMRATFAAEAEKIVSASGVSLGAGWDQGPWPAAAETMSVNLE